MKNCVRWVLLLLYSVPALFLAMWLEFTHCPMGWGLGKEALIAFLPAALLGFLSGLLGEKKLAFIGTAVNGGMNLLCVLSLYALPYTCGTCGVFWGAYFKPLSALQTVIFLFLLSVWLQWLFWLLGSGRRGRRGRERRI